MGKMGKIGKMGMKAMFCFSWRIYKQGYFPILFNQDTQKLILFNRGKAISGAPIIIGTNQFPKPPINIGITIKNSWLGLALAACHRTVRDSPPSYGSPYLV